MLKIHPYYFAGIEFPREFIKADIRFSPEFPEILKQVVERHTSLTWGEIVKKKGNLAQTEAKQTYIFIVKKYSTLSLSKIGALVDLNHSSICYSIRQIENYLLTDAEFRMRYKSLLKKINDTQKIDEKQIFQK